MHYCSLVYNNETREVVGGNNTNDIIQKGRLLIQERQARDKTTRSAKLWCVGVMIAEIGKYQVYTTSEVHTSKIPLAGSTDNDGIAAFKRFRLGHGDQSILKLKLMKIDESGNATEIVVPEDSPAKKKERESGFLIPTTEIFPRK